MVGVLSSALPTGLYTTAWKYHGLILGNFEFLQQRNYNKKNYSVLGGVQI